MVYIDLNYKPRETDVVCDFFLEPSQGVSMKDAAEQVAAESSVGTWTQVHTEKPYMKNLAARVFSIKGNDIRIAYPLELFEEGNIPQVLSSIAGNVFGMKALRNLKLNDASFPQGFLKSFKGPRFGIDGIRKILKIQNRPLLGTIVKPKLGLDTKDHAKVAYDAWYGGCDIVKDDENLTSQKFNPFEERIIKTLDMRDKAEYDAGQKKVYMPNITAPFDDMVKRAEFVKNYGGRYVMIDIVTCGFSALQSFRNRNLGLVIHAHRAMHAAMTRKKTHGISMLMIAKLARMGGVDQIHIGTVVGKMHGDAEEVENIEDEIDGISVKKDAGEHVLEQEWGNIKTTFPVCSGGLHPGHVPDLVKILGKNIIIQLGGGIHAHPHGTMAGAKAAKQAVDAVMKGQSLREAAKSNMELMKAMEKWKVK
jgi:ribulose-bisphosphate carboxylase large chain